MRRDSASVSERLRYSVRSRTVARGAAVAVATGVVFVFLWLAFPVQAQTSGTDPVATISMPWQNSLIRANVPVFGVANAKDFKLYRLEFGEGPKPKEWHVIRVSTHAEPSDPWAAGKVRWDPSRGADGNLATWDTGLTSYHYGVQTKNLNGVYTLRLVVEDKAGKTAEARTLVTVAREITKETGGIAESCDGKAFLNVEKDGISSAFVLVSLQPIDDRNPAIIELKPPKGLVPVGKTYEFQPPGLRLMKPAPLRICYEKSDLKHADASGRESELPEDKLGIYAYLPVKEVWAPLPGCKVHSETHEVRADLSEVTQYVSFYALMGDVTPPPPPTLKAEAASSEKSAVSVSGEAEPFSTVEIVREGTVLTRVDAGAEGTFSATGVPLEPGENVLAARAADARGNRSDASAAVKILRGCHPPKSVKGVEVLGKLKAERGDRFLIKLVGEDSDPGTNTAYARVSSETDKDGFEVELTETGPATGIYVATFTVGGKSEPMQRVIAALRHGEKVTAASAQEKDKTGRIEYLDTVPPSAPKSESATHPSVCQDGFEDGPNPLDEWANVDGEYGAELSRETQKGNTYLKLTKQGQRGHLGATARTTPYSIVKFPLVAFDYLLNPDVKMDFEVYLGGWRRVDLNDADGPDQVKAIGRFHGIISDGRWHHAELNLGSVLSGDMATAIAGIRFINWDRTAYMKTEFGRTGSKGSFYCIDNFQILSYGPGDAELRWSAEDENGIAGYSYVFDRDPGTVPPQTVAGTETVKSYNGLADGHWYFHVRARDTSGNWGPASRYMIVVDAKPPAAKLLGEPGSSGPRRRWDEPIRIQFDDGGGSGLNPYSVRLRLGQHVYGIESRALRYDPTSQILTFAPADVEPCPPLPADGEAVDVELLTASDHASHAVKDKVVCSYLVESPLKVTPVKPDGENGWYVTAPKIELRAPEGSTVDYAWAVTPEQDELFRKGNSINVLTMTVTDKGGKKQSYTRGFQLDTTVPVVTAKREDVGGKRVVVLSHDDYVLEQGTLLCNVYATADLTGTPILSGNVPAVDGAALPDGVKRRARSIRWSGSLLAPGTGVYRLSLAAGAKQRVELAIGGETILDTKDAKPGEQGVSTDVILKNTMQPVEVRWSSTAEVAAPEVSLGWQKERGATGERVPANAFFARRSLAQILYRWDGDPEQKYESPLAPPAGKHTLRYYARDEAGHKSTPQELATE